MKNYLMSTAILCTLAGGAFAATTNLDAVASFIASITLGNEVDLDFSSIAFSAAPTVAGDNIELGTDGAIAYNGVFAAGPSANPVAGQVEVTAGDIGSTVDIECDEDALMGDGNGETIELIDIEVTDDPTVFGSANACDDIGATAMSLVLTGDDVLYFGGKLRGHSASSGFPGTGVYSTATGGNDIQVDVNYQ